MRRVWDGRMEAVSEWWRVKVWRRVSGGGGEEERRGEERIVVGVDE